MFNQDELQKQFKFSPFVPYTPGGFCLYATITTSPHDMGVQPYEYTGWRDECRSWHDNCYIHSLLNPHTRFRITGPGAMKLFSDNCVNTFKNFPIGKGKHGIACNEDGLIIADGIILRLGEEEFILHELAYLAYLGDTGDYDVKVENLTKKEFIFQLAGPRSLEVSEAATGDNLHDIKFMFCRDSRVDGRKVRVLRVGMAGSLAYEFHGSVEDAIPVYNALIKAGEPYGLRKLGWRAYAMTHFEAGFPQYGMDFHYANSEDPELKAWLGKNQINFFSEDFIPFQGTAGSRISSRYRNPVELGWGGMINFDHDFVGRKALEKEVANPKRKMVTLVWNVDDIVDVFRSQFEAREPYQPIDQPEDVFSFIEDLVEIDGKVVGKATGRMISPYYQKMISLCTIDVEHSEIGTEVKVLWGNAGTPIKEIRATVAQYPYFNEDRNQTFDVNSIPCAANK